MLTADDVSKLTQTNVSTNGELTKTRTKELLRAATKAQREEIETLAGLKRVSINRVYSTGNISAKIAVAISQTLDLNPLYLTGEADELGDCTDEAIKSFLSAKGFDDVAKKVSKPVRKRQLKASPVAETEVSSAPIQVVEPQAEQEQQEQNETPAYSAMTEDETLQLIRSLFIQGKYSENARDTLDQIKALLVK